MRLDKFLADAGEGTRKEVKDMVKCGRILVNGKTAKDPGMQVRAEDEVLCDGRRIAAEQYVYLMLNKPAGVISATEDPREKTVLDLIAKPYPKGLAPVGRLDKDTVGLLLLTNDGALAHRLLSPKRHVDKTYLARVTGSVSLDTVRLLRQGVMLDDHKTAPAKVRIVKTETFATVVLVTIHEGRNRQVRRMFEEAGHKVLQLRRVRFGPLELGDLPRGQWRELTPEEERKLMAYL